MVPFYCVEDRRSFAAALPVCEKAMLTMMQHGNCRPFRRVHKERSKDKTQARDETTPWLPYGQSAHHASICCKHSGLSIAGILLRQLQIMLASELLVYYGRQVPARYHRAVLERLGCSGGCMEHWSKSMDKICQL
jgi:hypothetical protein